jgi:hypothetical protein
MANSTTLICAGFVAILLTASASGLSGAAEPPPAAETDRGREVQPPPQRVAPKPRVTTTSDRCETLYVNCILTDRQPRGSQCWCVTPFGPSYGRVP